MATDPGQDLATKSLHLPTATDPTTNPRGIPTAPFIERVEDYISSRAEVEPTLRSFREMIQKYQFMEASTQRRLVGLRDKEPDIRRTLEMCVFLQARGEGEEEGLETLFELNDTLYAKAVVGRTEEVFLWLGANVMLSYPLDEAVALLESKLDGAKQKIADCEEDLDFLREQITTLEVATARVYNWDVGQKRKEKDQDTGGEAGE